MMNTRTTSTAALLDEAFRLTVDIAQARRSPHGANRVETLGAIRATIVAEILRRAKDSEPAGAKGGN